MLHCHKKHHEYFPMSLDSLQKCYFEKNMIANSCVIFYLTDKQLLKYECPAAAAGLFPTLCC